MRLQIDRFEDGGWVVVLPHPDGRKGFDMPREYFPEGASVGDVFEVRMVHDPEKTSRLDQQNRRSLDDPAGKGR